MACCVPWHPRVWSSEVFPGVLTGGCSEADGSSPARVVREDRLLANLSGQTHWVAAADFDSDDLILYFRWKKQMPE